MILDLSNSAAKLSLEHNGAVPENYCGPCYGAHFKDEETSCCNTCEDVQRAYTDQGWIATVDDFEQCVREGWKEKTLAQSGEGCRMHGTLEVNKVRGNFHFSAGRAFSHGGSHIHDMSSFLSNTHGQNFDHKIDLLRFGSHEQDLQKQKRTKSSKLIHPLDNKEKWGNTQGKIN